MVDTLLEETSLKLAEALAERSDCQNRIEDFKKRLTRSARIQEGEEPAENSAELLAELDRTFARLLQLVQAINRTNAKTAFNSQQTIADAIAERDAIARRDLFAAIAEAASTRQDRYSKSEVRFIATIPVSNLQKQVDTLSKSFRELDTKIQELNWKTEV